MPKSYGFVKEPSGELYGEILRAGIAMGVPVLGLVYPRSVGRSPRATDLARRLSPFLITEKESGEWPGTELGNRTERVVMYRFEPMVVEIMEQVTRSLFDWIDPLPEDAHLVRDDASVWLGSIAHERDAWLELENDEFDRLQNEFPALFSAIADESDVVTFVTRLWEEHLSSAFPLGLEGEEVVEGLPPLNFIDASTAGCIQSFVSNRGSLDQERLRILKECASNLDEVIGYLDTEAVIYFHRLWRMAELILGTEDRMEPTAPPLPATVIAVDTTTLLHLEEEAAKHDLSQRSSREWLASRISGHGRHYLRPSLVHQLAHRPEVNPQWRCEVLITMRDGEQVLSLLDVLPNSFERLSDDLSPSEKRAIANHMNWGKVRTVKEWDDA